MNSSVAILLCAHDATVFKLEDLVKRHLPQTNEAQEIDEDIDSDGSGSSDEEFNPFQTALVAAFSSKPVGGASSQSRSSAAAPKRVTSKNGGPESAPWCRC